ncbi:hypothetical protein BTVI_13421 [Pitangus sulphuratus]|nr:hypothetical protein BTVI_13421 [Pitangus sulphuratus]
MMAFRILKGERKQKIKLMALDFRRVNFDLFKDLLGRVTWDKNLEEIRKKLANLQESQVPETSGKGWRKKDVALVEEDLAREYLNRMDIHLHGL